jgi:hypothetical protein
VMFAPGDVEQTMTVERNTWKAFRMIATYFLGNSKCENHEEIVEYVIQHYKVLGCRMSVKLHCLHTHLELLDQI